MQELLITACTKIQSSVQLSSHFSLCTMTFKMYIRCYALFGLAQSFHGHSSKISDPDSGLF